MTQRRARADDEDVCMTPVYHRPRARANPGRFNCGAGRAELTALHDRSYNQGRAIFRARIGWAGLGKKAMAEQNPLDEYAAEVSAALARDTVQVKNASVEHVEGGQVSLTNSAAQKVTTQALYMDSAAAVIVNTQTLEATDSVVGAVVVGNLSGDTVDARVIVARNVSAAKVNARLLLALHVNGPVEAKWTPLPALAAGAAFAATLVGLSQLVKWLRRLVARKS